MHKRFLSSNIFRGGLIAAFIFVVYFLSSCEKEVHINLASSPPSLVVEGQIENGQWPYVILTNSIGFFSKIDLSTFQNSFVHGAKITVSDGSTSIVLREYSVDTSGGNKLYVYTIDSADKAALNFKGEVNKFYSLKIEYNGQTYTSVTKIPTPIPIDSLTAKEPPVISTDNPNEMQLFIHFKDPDTIGNYARYFTNKNHEGYFNGEAFSDVIANGVYENLRIRPGYNPINPDSTSLNIFNKGDTISVKWSSIDNGVYTFLNTLAFAQNAIGNPFSTPINAKSNISNGALGCWAGYGSSIVTIIIPK
ncbi:MAG: DUF4249 domain-containing protein [Flavipsychrobacter sp.]